MRRVIPALAATAGGLALLANFHTSPTSSGVIAASAAPDSTTTTESTSTTTTAVIATTRPMSTTTITTTTTTPGHTTDGPVFNNKWGNVQVRVTVDNGRITDVQALKLPDSNSHSTALSRAVQRRLREEVLQAQSADVDIVSGATLTSDNYLESLQAALDQGGH